MGRELGLGGLLLFLAAFSAASCGKTAGPGSGETHFLQRCETTCSGDYQCLCGVCTKPCDADVAGACSDEASAASCVVGCGLAETICEVGCATTADCAELGSDFECSAGVCRQPPPAAMGCGSGCFPVVGYPLDTGRSCFDVDRGEEVACQCGLSAANSICRTRLSDGTQWMLPDGELADPAAWSPCYTNDDVTWSCDFFSCEERPSSVCSADDTCAGRSCGNYQSFPDGCARIACEQDEDCPADERCVELPSIDISFCSYSSEGICNCGGPTIDVSGAFCNPTSETGPRGEWQELRIVEDCGECAADSGDFQWRISPDGSVALVKEGVESTALLSPDDLVTLELLIDGPELRRDLSQADPSCVVEDHDITFELVLSEQPLLQIVTNCIDNPEANAYGRLWQIVQGY